MKVNFKYWLLAAGICCTVACEDNVEGSNNDSIPVVPPVINEEVLFQADFQSSETGMDLFVSYDVDQQQPTLEMMQLGFTTGTAWIGNFRDATTSVNVFAGSTSAYNPAGQANDWLVTAQPVQIPSEGFMLFWKSQALDLAKRDGIKVFISTQGNNPSSDFGDTPVFEIEEEEAGTTANTDNEWTEHSVSLDAYAGKNIWIAFVNQSTDKYMLCLDDVQIKTAQYVTLKNASPVYSTNGEVKVKGILTAKDSPVNGFTAYYQTADGKGVGQKFDQVKIEPGQSYEFTFSEPMTLSNQGEYTNYQLWVDVNGSAALVNDSVAYVAFEPMHKVVLEEGTGQWCGYCPLGILAMEYLEELYPEELIGIAVHNGDVMTVSAYDRGMAFSGFPSARINRSQITYSPMTVTYELTGAGTFHDGFVAALQEMPEAEVRLKQVTKSGNTVSVNSEVRFVLNRANSDYRLAYVVIADNCKASGKQNNYLYSSDEPAFGRFGKGGEYGQPSISNMAYEDVACGIFPSFSGEKGVIPANAQINNVYSHEYQISLDACKNIYEDVELELAVLLIDGATGEIVNADKLSFE